MCPNCDRRLLLPRTGGWAGSGWSRSGRRGAPCPTLRRERRQAAAEPGCARREPTPARDAREPLRGGDGPDLVRVDVEAGVLVVVPALAGAEGGRLPLVEP